MRIVTLILFLTAMNLISQAQKTNLRVGLDSGIKHYDLVEELANSNKYEGTTFSVLNPTLYWITDKKISFLRLSYSSLSLESEVEDSDFSANFIDIGISYNYLWNVKNWNKFSIYIGGTLNSHLKAYFQNFQGRDEINVFESSLINLRLSSIIKFNTGSWNIYFQPEVGLLNYWTKAIPLGTSINDYAFQADVFRFNEFQISIFGIHKLSKRWEFKPEYSISYYNYDFKESHSSKVLNQRWIIGFYYIL
jgi:hypothetical protein